MNRFQALFQFQRERIIRNIKQIRKSGYSGMLKKAWELAKDLVYLRFDGYLLEMSSPHVTYTPEREIDYSIVEIKVPIDLSHLIKELTLENVAYRLMRGEYCFVAIHDERAVGTMWLTNIATYFPSLEFRVMAKGKWIHMDHKSGFVYRGAVDENYRGHRIFSALYNAVILKAIDLGIYRLSTTQGFRNIAVRKAALRSGWKVVALVTCKRICMFHFRERYDLESITL